MSRRPAAPASDAAVAAGSLPVVDDRAVRVTVAVVGGGGVDPPVVVAPATASQGTSGDPLVDGAPVAAVLVHADDRHAVLVHDGDHGANRTHVLFGPVRRDGPDGVQLREVVVHGWLVEVEIQSARRAALRDRARRGANVAGHGGPVEIRAIIPGRVVAVSVAAGDSVAAGQQVLVVEAMKMQNELRAPREGTVVRIGVAIGDTIDVGDLLVIIN